ncbi:MAG TPA: hypothetical protein VNQ73_02460 [Ilumatobacter sp.]|nr:hypothetical protein [Ilumatobacter sp.]
MFTWGLGGLGALFGLAGDVIGGVVGWAWDKVVIGIYTWLANGLALLIEWVWSVLDSATTPRVTANWFANDLAVQVGLLALAVTIALMLASAVQAALAGRPEQIGDAVKQAVWSIVGSALTVTVIDVLIRVVDEASAVVWQSGRSDLVSMIEGMVVVATTTGPLGQTFVGPLCLLIGFLGLIGLVVSLMMRSALIYVAAALAPLVFAANVLPLFRGSARKLIHLAVALIVSKLAIVITLVVAVGLVAHPTGDPDSGSVVNDAAAAVGTLMAGFMCFIIASVTPLVLYKLMPTVEAAAIGSGVAGGWGRSAMTAVHAGLMVKSLGASAATKQVAGQGSGAGRPGSVAGLTGHQANPSQQQAQTSAAGRTGSSASPATATTTADAAQPAQGPHPDASRSGDSRQRRSTVRGAANRPPSRRRSDDPHSDSEGEDEDGSS